MANSIEPQPEDINARFERKKRAKRKKQSHRGKPRRGKASSNERAAIEANTGSEANKSAIPAGEKEKRRGQTVLRGSKRPDSQSKSGMKDAQHAESAEQTERDRKRPYGAKNHSKPDDDGFAVQDRRPSFSKSRHKDNSLTPDGGIFSAIDLGTNNCRLLIARPTAYGFRVVDAFSRIVRLGEGMDRSTVLSEPAIERSVEALKICAEKIGRRGVTSMRHVATQACRVAKNSDAFVERIRRETGLNIEVISAVEEARLAVMGCQSLVAANNRFALVFDIGGGSTELIWVRMTRKRQAEIHGWLSIPWGVVNLSERFAPQGQEADPQIYHRMVQEAQQHLDEFEETYAIRETIKNRRVQFLGTSGTVTTLASLHLKLPRYMRDRVDGAWMKSEDIRRLSREVAMMPLAERAAQPCIGRERADLVVAGCAILEAILSTWQVPSLRVADRGIREGILRGLMQIDTPPRLMSDLVSF